jgi:hypothetical protein
MNHLDGNSPLHLIPFREKGKVRVISHVVRIVTSSYATVMAVAGVNRVRLHLRRIFGHTIRSDHSFDIYSMR